MTYIPSFNDNDRQILNDIKGYIDTEVSAIKEKTDALGGFTWRHVSGDAYAWSGSYTTFQGRPCQYVPSGSNGNSPGTNCNWFGGPSSPQISRMGPANETTMTILTSIAIGSTFTITAGKNFRPFGYNHTGTGGGFYLEKQDGTNVSLFTIGPSGTSSGIDLGGTWEDNIWRNLKFVLSDTDTKLYINEVLAATVNTANRYFKSSDVASSLTLSIPGGFICGGESWSGGCYISNTNVTWA